MLQPGSERSPPVLPYPWVHALRAGVAAALTFVACSLGSPQGHADGDTCSSSATSLPLPLESAASALQCSYQAYPIPELHAAIDDLLRTLKPARDPNASRWPNGKCYSFSERLAKHLSLRVHAQPMNPPQLSKTARDLRFRGCKISDLREAVSQGILQPGMVIHTKSHWNSAQTEGDEDGNHWLTFVGMSASGVPLFFDDTSISLRKRQCTWRDREKCFFSLDQYRSNIENWAFENSRYGQRAGVRKAKFQYGIEAIYDPLNRFSGAPNDQRMSCSRTRTENRSAARPTRPAQAP